MIFRVRMFLAVAGLMALAAVHVGLARSLSRMMTERYLQREALVAQEFLSGILDAGGNAATLFDQPAPSPALTAFAAHVRSLPGILRVNIYGPDGFIRQSSEPNLVGVQFSDNGDLTQSFSGKPVVSLQDPLASGKSEHLALGSGGSQPIIEAYIPVADAAGKVVTVVEFYRKDTVIGELVANINRLIGMAAAANGLVLLAVTGLAMLIRRRRKSRA